MLKKFSYQLEHVLVSQGGSVQMYFVSKKDILYFLAIWGTILFISFSYLFGSESFGIIDGLIRFVIVGYLIWIWFRTRYKIEENILNIQCGGFNWKINIEEIRKIRKVKSIFAAPALSIDRLEILYGKYDVVSISPKNEDKFIELLLNENPQIPIDVNSNY